MYESYVKIFCETVLKRKECLKEISFSTFMLNFCPSFRVLSVLRFLPNFTSPDTFLKNRVVPYFSQNFGTTLPPVGMRSSGKEVLDSRHENVDLTDGTSWKLVWYSSKAGPIRTILFGKEALYARVLMQDTLEPHLGVHKMLESATLLLPRFDHLVNVALQHAVLMSFAQWLEKSDQARYVWSTLTKSGITLVKTHENLCVKLFIALWNGKSPRQNPVDVTRKLGAVLHACQKRLLSWSFGASPFPWLKTWTQLARCLYGICWKHAPLTHVEVMDYWQDTSAHYPGLANGSCDVEKMFSQLRYLQRAGRPRMEIETLVMQMIMYTNKDFEKAYSQLVQIKCFVL